MNTSIKTGMLILISLLLTVSFVDAETKYVSEGLTITLRTGPGADRKTISMIPIGRAVEVVTPGDEWTEVLLSNGKQGWALTRYLTDKEPASMTLARLQQQYTRMKNDYEALQKRSSQLSSEGKGLAGELAQTQKALSKLTSEHETLKNDSKEFLALKAKYSKALKDSQKAREEANKLQDQYKELYSNELNKGLLIGGGMIVLGFIAGFILKRPKRRSPLL
jgi:SH3 domain protein